MVVHHRRVALALALAACTAGEPDDTGAACATEDGGFTAPEAIAVGDALTFARTGDLDCGTSLWDFGDGTQSGEPEPSHTYADPGHYHVVHRLDLDGRAVTADAVVTVYRPATGTTSASATLLADGDDFVAVVPERGVVRTGPSGFDVYDGCDQPRTAAWGDGVLGVACEGDDALVLLTDLAETTRVDLGPGSRPFGVAFDGEAFWVSLQGTGELARYDGALTRVAVTADPRAVAVGPDGRVFATRFLNPDGEGRIGEVGAAPMPLAFADEVDSDNTNRGVPNLLEHLAVSPDGGTLYVPGQVSNTARGLYRDGLPLVHDTTVRAVLRGLDLATGDEIPALDRQFDNHGRAGAIALSPLGDWLWVAFPDTETLFRIDAYTGRPDTSLHDVGRGVTGLVVSDDGATLAVFAWLDREVRRYDVASGALIDVFPAVDVEPLAADVLAGKRLFHDASDTRMTKDGYISCASCHPDGRDDGLTWDFTDRGEGLRNTTSLEGRAGTAMGRLHWTGNFDEVQDFEHDIRGPFAGLGFLAETDWLATDDPLGAPKAGRSTELDGLAAYLSSLDQLPVSPFATDTDGEALFAELGCADCHAGTLYTDSSVATPVRHDVGTLTAASGTRLGEPLDGLDTPTLLGVWATAPYLHDGSAATVEEAIEAHATGLTRAPTSAEVTAVAGFVRSL